MWYHYVWVRAKHMKNLHINSFWNFQHFSESLSSNLNDSWKTSGWKTMLSVAQCKWFLKNLYPLNFQRNWNLQDKAKNQQSCQQLCELNANTNACVVDDVQGKCTWTTLLRQKNNFDSQPKCLVHHFPTSSFSQHCTRQTDSPYNRQHAYNITT